MEAWSHADPFGDFGVLYVRQQAAAERAYLLLLLARTRIVHQLGSASAELYLWETLPKSLVVDNWFRDLTKASLLGSKHKMP